LSTRIRRRIEVKMSRRRTKPKPKPLDPALVAGFHTSVLAGDIDGVNRQLSTTRRLANSKDEQERTPLMNAVRSDVASAQTKIRLIDCLMQNGGAEIATRGPDRCHVLLLACKMGCEPKVIDCILRWNRKRQNRLSWSHCNNEKDGPLVLAARSGALNLVSHLLSLAESDTTDCYGEDSNSPVKVVEAAIKSGNEQLVLLVLGHERFKGNIEDVSVVEDDYDSDSDDWYGASSPTCRSITVASCVQEAYNRKMFNAVCKLASQNRSASVQVWLCWRKNKAILLESERKDDITQINDIAVKCQGDLVHQYNPTLLPLLVARSRYAAATDDNVDEPLSQFLLHCDDNIFRHIAPYCFEFCRDKLQQDVESDIYFKENAEWCCDCEGWFLPYACDCNRYCGYSS